MFNKSEQMLHRVRDKNVLQLKKTNHKTLEFLLDLLFWEETESVQTQHKQELRDTDYFPGIDTDLTSTRSVKSRPLKMFRLLLLYIARPKWLRALTWGIVELPFIQTESYGSELHLWRTTLQLNNTNLQWSWNCHCFWHICNCILCCAVFLHWCFSS